MRRRTMIALAGLLLAAMLAGCAAGADGGDVDDERPGVRVREGTITHLEGDVAIGVSSVRAEISAQLSVATPDASADIELAVGEHATVGTHTVELLRISGGGVNVEVVDEGGGVLEPG